MSKDRAPLDFPDLTGFAPKKKPEINTEEVRAAAEGAGFNTRHAPTTNTVKPTVAAPVTVTSGFDARSLRKSNRTAKLNIATSPATRERFWGLAQASGLLNGEDVLIAMMQSFEEQLAQQK